MTSDRVWTHVTSDPLRESPLTEFVTTPESGGVVLFAGVVRSHHEGRGVVAIEYTAARVLAEAKLREIAADVLRDPVVHRVAALHRIGSLGIGDASVMVAASAAHREDAFRAARRLIDRIKEIVPVWKHEHFEDGTKAWAPGFTVASSDCGSRPVGEEVSGC